MPIIILGGIYSGFFTPTEAAVVSVVYGIIIGVFVYKELTLKKVVGMFRDNVAFIGGMMFTFAPAAALGSVFSYLGIQKAISAFFLGISTNPYIILMLVFLILTIAGMFVQTTPCVIILSPILLAVVQSVRHRSDSLRRYHDAGTLHRIRNASGCLEHVRCHDDDRPQYEQDRKGLPAVDPGAVYRTLYFCGFVPQIESGTRAAVWDVANKSPSGSHERAMLA